MASHAQVSLNVAAARKKPSTISVWSAPGTVATIATAGISLHLILRFVLHASKPAWRAPLIAVLVLGGLPLLIPLARKFLARQFGADHLAGVSIITSVILGEYLVGVIVILMLSGGSALEEFASRRASSVLDALARRMPQVAHRRLGHDVSDVKLGDIAVGDTLVVFPHEVCPVDGVVVEGNGKMNEAYLTGEPFEIEKMPGSQVISGAINDDRAIHIRAEKLAVDSRFARITGVVLQSSKATLRNPAR